MRPLPLFIILLLISIVAFMVRLPFLHEPVDRDTGFFAIVGKYMHEGVALYRNVIDNKPPGIFLAFFILSVFFKPTLFIVKLFVLFVAIMSAILIYFLTNEIFTKKAAYLASFIFTVFSSSPFIEGNQAMIENFMLPFVLMGIILFIKYVKKQNALFVILSGIFLGIGFIFKQVVLFDFVAVTFYMFLLFIFFQRRHSISVLIKHYILLTVAFFTPFVIAIAYFNLKGALKDFIFSVFTFNVNYIKLLGYGQNSYWGKFFYFNSEIFKRFSFLCLAGMIFIILAFSAKMKKEKSRIYWVFLAIWALCVFLGICLSGRFFPHYYITLVPILSIMSAQLILITIGSMQSKRIHFTFFFIAVCLLISLAFSFFQQ